VAKATVYPRYDAQRVADLLDSPEVRGLIAELQETRQTGRPGYAIRSMVGMAPVKSLHALPTWTRTVALVRDHAGLREIVGNIPSVWACYRFTGKLRQFSEMVERCIGNVLGSLRAEVPEMGEHVAIDASDMPAYANGQRFLSKNGPERKRYSDPDAWGHRSAISTRKGGGFYGYRVHAAVCTTTGLPVAWQVETARKHEAPTAASVLDATIARGFKPETCALDKGYDVGPAYDACEARGVRPIIPIRQTPAVTAGGAEPPSCEHGVWTFAGSDAKRGASKWRCPTGACSPASTWVKADRLHPLVPRTTARFRALYHQRGAVEREFGRLKHEWALLPLRVRRIERVRLHANLSILARLAVALDKARGAQETHGLASAA
jgi:Transposase DDE domain